MFMSLPKILIIGGGYAAIHAAKGLQALHRRGKAQVTVISKDSSHLFHGWTSEVISGQLDASHARSPLSYILRKVNFITGTVNAVDREQKRVFAQIGPQEISLAYDQLIVAAGSIDPKEILPGLNEHGWGIKSAREFRRFLRHLHHQLEIIQSLKILGEEPKRAAINVIGGGFAGVENACAIVEIAKKILGKEINPVTIRLFVGERGLLANTEKIGANLKGYSRRKIEKKGIEIINERVQKVAKDHLITQNGSRYDSAITLGTIGVRIETLPGLQDLPINPRGQLIVTSSLQSPGDPSVWSAGDYAQMPLKESSKTCPINALWAIKSGAFLAKNLKRALKGQSLQAFRYGGLGQAASFDKGSGIAEIYGMQFKGFLAWLLRAVFFLRFMPIGQKRHQVFWLLLRSLFRENHFLYT
jgi:NADH dehydrogenase